MPDMKRREFMILLSGAAACPSRRALWRQPVRPVHRNPQPAAGVWATGLWGRRELFWFGARPVGIHWFSVRIGRVDPARFDFDRVLGRDDHIDGPPFNPHGTRLRQIKIPTTREFLSRVFDLCTIRLEDWTDIEPQNLPLAEVIEVIVRSYRLDSEQFRSAPRTCWPLCGRLSRPAAWVRRLLVVTPGREAHVRRQTA